MPADSIGDREPRYDTLAVAIDEARREFERRWQAHERPSIEGHLDLVPEELRPGLLRQLLLIDLLYRSKAGEMPTAREYASRFKDATEIVEAVFSQFAAAETVSRTFNPSASTQKGPGPTIHIGITGRLGDYELLEEIARGGMGVVYRARQVSLGRLVALKTILAGNLAGKEEVQRFRAEAEAAARLNHPNIVPVYEVGEHDGRHYFSMGLVEGQSLADAIRDDPPNPRDAAALVKTLAEAVAYAHSRGIVHRDLKPSNVLLDEKGVPRITDFGLARRIESDSSLTATGQVMGTPSYMPPEQALGRTSEVGPLADVYALGAILYHLLTGRPPFRAASVPETLRQVVEDDPVPPRQLDPSVPRDLETICLKCLEKESGRRYGSASELGNEIEHFLRGEAIQARPIGRIERTWRWCRRNSVVASLIMAAFVLLVAGTAVSSWFAIDARTANGILRESQGTLSRTNRDLKRSQTGLQTALGREKDANEALATSHLDLQRQLRVSQANGLAMQSAYARLVPPRAYRRAVLLATEAVHASRVHGEPPTVAAEQALRDALGDVGGIGLVGHSGPVMSIAISPDSRWLITAGSEFRTGREDAVHAWDLSAEEPGAVPRILQGPEGSSGPLIVSPNGRWIITGGGGSHTTVLAWNLTDVDPWATPRILRGHEREVSRMEISADGRWLVTGSGDKTIRIWDLSAENAGANPRVLRSHEDSIRHLSMSPDGRWLAIAGSDDNSAHVWDLSTADPELRPHLLQGHEGDVSSVLISPDGEFLVTSSKEDKTIRVRPLTADENSTTPRVLHDFCDEDMTISPDNRWIVASACSGRGLHAWDLAHADESIHPLSLVGHMDPLVHSKFSPDGRWLVSGARFDETAMLWDLSGTAPGETPLLLGGHETGVRTFAFSMDGRTLAVGTYAGTVRLWDVSVDNPAATSRLLLGHDDAVTSMTFSPDGGALTTGSFDHTARVWKLDPDPLREPRVLRGHEGEVGALSISQNGEWLVTSGLDGTARVWSLDDERRKPRVLQFVGERESSVDMSADGRWVAVAMDMERGLHLWDLKLGRPDDGPRVLERDNKITSFGMSPDGRWLVAANLDGTVKRWDLSAPDPLRAVEVLELSERSASKLTFAPGGKWLLIRQWPAKTTLWSFMPEDREPELGMLRDELDMSNVIHAGVDWLLTIEGDTCHVWDLSEEVPRLHRSLHEDVLCCLDGAVVSPDGRWLITTTTSVVDTDLIRVWDLSAEDVAGPRILQGHEEGDAFLAMSGDGHWLAAASYVDDSVFAWRVLQDGPSGEPCILRGHESRIYGLEFTPDGRKLVTVSRDRTARVWDMDVDRLLVRARRIAGATAGRSVELDMQ